MAAAASSVLIAAALLLFLGFLAFGLTCRHERELRAERISYGLAVLVPLLPLSALLLPPAPRLITTALFAVFALTALTVLLVPIGSRLEAGGRPSRRVDERDIMFARARLVPGSPEHEAYYTLRPENRASDERTRELPGLLSLQAQKAEPKAFAAAEAAFAITEALRDQVDGPVAANRRELSPEEATAELERLAMRWGARDVGATELHPYHVYSHVGRGTGTWGEAITPDHRWAVAFTVEMDHAAMRFAPEAPVLAESARQYVEAAKIALQLAGWIRSVGYPARAHIDGNYRVIAPLVALDAGLGEIGRMGILMTPRLGPRVRLGVVTTNLPLMPDDAGDDASMLDFCSICRKCADNCPPGAIPVGDRESLDGALRWKIDSDACFRYWSAVGTDCGRCMAICPYSHPDSASHNLVRWAARRSAAGRRVLLRLDDLFYGRHPAPPAV